MGQLLLLLLGLLGPGPLRGAGAIDLPAAKRSGSRFECVDALRLSVGLLATGSSHAALLRPMITRSTVHAPRLVSTSARRSSGHRTQPIRSLTECSESPSLACLPSTASITACTCPRVSTKAGPDSQAWRGVICFGTSLVGSGCLHRAFRQPQTRVLRLSVLPTASCR